MKIDDCSSLGKSNFLVNEVYYIHYVRCASHHVKYAKFKTYSFTFR